MGARRLPPPPPGQVPPPPTSLPSDAEAENRSNLMIIAMIILGVIMVLILIPAGFDWSSRSISPELDSKLDIALGAMIGLMVDVIRRAGSIGPTNRNRREEDK